MLDKLHRLFLIPAYAPVRWRIALEYKLVILEGIMEDVLYDETRRAESMSVIRIPTWPALFPGPDVLLYMLFAFNLCEYFDTF